MIKSLLTFFVINEAQSPNPFSQFPLAPSPVYQCMGRAILAVVQAVLKSEVQTLSLYLIIHNSYLPFCLDMWKSLN